MKAVLRRRDKLSADISTFWFEPDGQFEYLAGQAAEFVLPHAGTDDRGQRRWFTLSSSPTEDLLAITTKRGHSSFKQTLFELKPGDEVSLLPAMGDFVLPKNQTLPLVFVAAGLGITPVRSIVRYLIDEGEKRDIQLVYSAREHIFDDVLSAYPMQNTLHSSKAGRLTAEQALAAVKAAPDTLFYISGPDAFTEQITQGLKLHRVRPGAIVADFFTGY